MTGTSSQVSRCAIFSNASGRPRWTPRSNGSAQQTWIAALTVIVDRDGGDLPPQPPPRRDPLRTRGAPGDHQVRRAETLPAHPQQNSSPRSPTRPGWPAHRAGALERVQLLLEDWAHAHHRLAETEARRIGVLDELGLTRLVAAAKYDRFGTGATVTAYLDSSCGRGTRSCPASRRNAIASALGHTDVHSTARMPWQRGSTVDD